MEQNTSMSDKFRTRDDRPWCFSLMLAPTVKPKPPAAASTRSLTRFPTTAPLVFQPAAGTDHTLYSCIL